MPLYTLADRSAAAVFRHIPPKLPTVQWINYLRVPVVLSGLLLLIWFPLIFRLPTGFQAADDPVAEPLPLALARGDRSPVPAVRRRARPATAHRSSGPA